MGKIHYATGGLITPEKSEFRTLCGRKFRQGHSEIMQSGYVGAKNVTCKDCRWILDITKEKKDTVWYEVTDGQVSRNFYTQKEAEQYLKDMRRGHPKNERMTEENHQYWKKAGKRNYVTKVVQKTVTVSY